MYAKEAREKATVIAIKRLDDNYNAVKADILSCVEDGTFVLNYFNNILLETEYRLKEEGYELIEATARQGEYNTIIKW